MTKKTKKTQHIKQEELTLKGVISKIKFKGNEGWSVFEIKTTLPDNSVFTTCTGTLSEIIDKNTEVVCKGSWEKTKYGEQFKCSNVTPEEIKPDDGKGVERLLMSLPGLGEVKAKQAIKKFGYKQAWEIAQTYPSVLGIYQLETALKAKEKAIKLNSGEDFKAISFMLSIGLTDNQIQKILSRYSKDALNIVQNNPYKLIRDIDGFGFYTVDKIALKAGIKVNNPSRINACVMYCLLDSEKNNGNIYINGRDLINIVLLTLTDSGIKNNMSLYDAPEYGDVKKCIFTLQEEGLVIINGAKIYSKQLLEAEKIIEKKIKEEECLN